MVARGQDYSHINIKIRQISKFKKKYLFVQLKHLN